MENQCFLCEKPAAEHRGGGKACLKRFWVFENLEEPDLEAFGLHIRKNRYLPGDTVFSEGDPVSRMFFIYSGRIRLWKTTDNGGEVTLDIRSAGDIMGEGMFGGDSSLPVSATCLEETVTCGLSREGFERLVLTRPGIGLRVIVNLSRHIDRLACRIEDLSRPSIEERLYGVLLNISREYGRRTAKGTLLPLHLTHEDLAFLIGAHRVSVTRAMKELTASRRVLREGGFLVIPPRLLEADFPTRRRE